MNDFIKFTGPADIPAFIPHTLGETPKDSFVALTVQGNKLGATLRVDGGYWLPRQTAPVNRDA